MAIHDEGSRVPIPPGSDFPLANLPYGSFDAGEGPRLGVAAGDAVVDLRRAAGLGLLPHADALGEETLNPFLSLGKEAWEETRGAVLRLLTTKAFDRLPAGSVVPIADVSLLLPFTPGDFVDFYSSLEHATNLGRMFRPDGEPLLPNWRHLPVGYHGRAGTVVVSGTPIKRPSGQVKPTDGPPEYRPTAALDIELEVGFITGPGNRPGEAVGTDAAGDHIFGMVLVNDWSARDIQRWEYQPLGPFLGKSFATSVSPWVVTMQALEPFMVEGPSQVPPPPSYLSAPGKWGVDIRLEVRLRPQGSADAVTISRTGFAGMYWTVAQQLAHATANGATVRPGDLFASGTVSGADPGTQGSLIELTWNGRDPIVLGDGTTRTFLADGDSVEITGWCEGEGRPRIGFGTCEGTVV